MLCRGFQIALLTEQLTETPVQVRRAKKCLLVGDLEKSLFGEEIMGFEQFGIVSFTGATKADQFIEFLKDNELRGTVCMRCGAKFFPPRSDCDECLSGDMEWYAITGEGRLITFTKAMFAPAGRSKIKRNLPAAPAPGARRREVRRFRALRSIPLLVRQT